MKTERTRLVLDLVSTIALTSACVALIWSVIRSPTRRGQASRPGGEIQTVDLETGSWTATAGAGHRPPDVAILEFSDFQCPFCGQYARTTYPQLRREFVDSNVADYEFRHFPLSAIHPFASKASEAAECSRDGGKYWQMHDQLFANQDKLAEPELVSYATALGLDEPRFRECLQGSAASRVRDDQAEGARLGVTSTPTFFIGRRQPNGRLRLTRKIVGVASYSTFRAALQQVLGVR